MQYKIIKSTIFFQDLLTSYFHRMRQQVVETLLLLCVGPSLWTLQPESSRITGERQILTDFITHFHTITPKEP